MQNSILKIRFEAQLCDSCMRHIYFKLSNIKQTEDGMDRAFSMVAKTPGSGNAVYAINTATVKFPLTVGVEPHIINDKCSYYGPTLEGDSSKKIMTKHKNSFYR